MLHHVELTNRNLKSLIDKGAIKFGGNSLLKIYGTLSCNSGKRMKKENRVFFKSEEEAFDEGYRPCGHCMKKQYEKWQAKTTKLPSRVVMPPKEAWQKLHLVISLRLRRIEVTSNPDEPNPLLSSDNSLPPHGSMKS
jgi:hypothetical protein